MGDPCRLAFVNKVRMPARRAPRVPEVGFGFCCLQLWPDDGYTRNTWDLGYLRLESVSLGLFEIELGEAYMNFDLSIPFT